MASTTKEWVAFFQKAGIPSNESASYALIFTKNRIQRNMLPDLNKEYLRDMGITLLGDIIAILKHAQSVHETNSRALLLADSAETVDSIDLTTKKSSSGSGSSATVKRLLDHYTTKYKEAEEILSAIPEPDAERNTHSANAKLGKKSDHKRTRAASPIAVEKKRQRSLMNESPTITINNRISAVKSEKKNVFKRLGESTVSSTTPEVKPKEPGYNKLSSIFSRLGDVTSTSLEGERLAIKEDALPYAGVFKHVALSKTTGSVSLMRTDVKEESHFTPSKRKLDASRDERNESPSVELKTNFLKARELKMLKITTEFSEEDNDTSATSALYQASTSAGPPPKRRKSGESEEYQRDTLPPKPPLKKVRFGGTTHAIIPSATSSYNRKPSPLLKHFTNLKITAAAANAKLAKSDIKSRIGTKPPPSQPFSKMVSDSMIRQAPSNKLSIKNRVNLKQKSKLSIHDRLG